MLKYRVMIRGHNFLIDVDGCRQQMGFCTEVFVEAGDEEEAETRSMDVLCQDSKLRKKVLNGPEDRPRMSVIDIFKVVSFEGCTLPRTELAFYVEDHDARRAQQIDDAIVAYLATKDSRESKVSVVFNRTKERVGGNFPEGQVGYELFNRRMQTLVDCGRIVAKGDVVRWMYCDVKLA